jgi:hypothetical protein
MHSRSGSSSPTLASSTIFVTTRVFPAAVKLQHVADPMKRRSHRFDTFGIDVVFRKRDGCGSLPYYPAPKQRRMSVRQRTHQENIHQLGDPEARVVVAILTTGKAPARRGASLERSRTTQARAQRET